MSSTLENEDLENVQLVRMEDVQPSRERPGEVGNLKEELQIWDVPESPQNEEIDYLVKEEELETCIVDDFEYDNECVVEGNDEDSNIGSMVSVAEDMGNRDDGSAEIIVPEALTSVNNDVHVIRGPPKPINAPQSWPTLEILPGGVINHLEKVDDNLDAPDKEPEEDPGVMVYACAKCPERFQYLFNLVKHVRSHEIQHVEMPRPKQEPVKDEREVKLEKKRKMIKRIINNTGRPLQLVRIKKPTNTHTCLSPINKNDVITKVGRRKIVKVPKISKS